MKFDFFSRFCLLCLCAIMLISCDPKKETPKPQQGSLSDREVMLVHYADEIIIPSYTKFKVKLDSLTKNSLYFTKNPTIDSLTGLRNAWVDAYIEWQRIELFGFETSPSFKHNLRFSFNVYPTDVPGINANITSGTANLDLSTSDDQQGFPALDYLINGLGATDEEILSYYTTAADSAKRIAYLNKIITQMNDKFNKVYSDWTGGYRNTFVSNATLEMYSPTSIMVNGFVQNYEAYIRTGKFGIPSGAMFNGAINPEKVEAFYKKDISLILAKAAQQASLDFFNGKSVKSGIEGSSLKTYLNSIDAKDNQTGVLLSKVINDQFTLVNGKLDLLGNNLVQEVQTNNQAMTNVYNEMQFMVGILKVDLVSAMSISIIYQDTDGD